MRTRIWDHQDCDLDRAAELARELGVEPIVARLLLRRGLTDAETAWRFLNPTLDHLHDPLRLAGMIDARDRLRRAIAAGERIAVYGDYDVDGVTSTVILQRAIERLGGVVDHFIPHRLHDGYGLLPRTLDELHASGVHVVVSVDCGIRGREAAERARELGVDLIITDHHEPEHCLPPALAVVNPKREDCTYPDKNLAGVGVALKLVQALLAGTEHARTLPAFVKMAAIGTIADVVPLVGENRVIAKLGLAELSKGPHAQGLQALLDVTGLSGRRLDGYHVGFVLGPRLNAAGRMASPDLASRLLLTSGAERAPEARALAEQLDEENSRRQVEEATIVAEARRRIETWPDIGAHNMLVVAGEEWHRGVIGIVASRLVDAFHKPAVVLSVQDGIAQGSCRSIPAFDMLGALERCADLLLKFGGHRQAAGLTLDAERVPELRARLSAHADAVLEPEDLMPRLRIDEMLRLSAVTPALAGALDVLAPFGPGNRRPVFSSAVEIVRGPDRLKDKHLTMTVRDDGRMLRAVAWRGVHHADLLAAHRARLELAYTVETNTYRGETSLELSVSDIRAPGGGPGGADPSPPLASP